MAYFALTRRGLRIHRPAAVLQAAIEPPGGTVLCDFVPAEE